MNLSKYASVEKGVGCVHARQCVLHTSTNLSSWTLSCMKKREESNKPFIVNGYAPVYWLIKSLLLALTGIGHLLRYRLRSSHLFRSLGSKVLETSVFSDSYEGGGHFLSISFCLTFPNLLMSQVPIFASSVDWGRVAELHGYETWASLIFFCVLFAIKLYRSFNFHSRGYSVMSVF